ncbi:MAG: enoyl-CoA hydratase/isomerase family protein [Lachnospiraceae bacterium]|nr:enoyl-CoA hydratase/isomerase family protein [Lachnospiraceae bacterium]
MYFRTETKNGIARIVFERPPVNAMNAEAYREMARIFDETGRQKETRCIILETVGKGFIGGNDVDEIAAHTRENHSEYQEIVGSAVMAIRNCSVPVIARVQGYAIGSGMLIALACDLVIANERAWFSLPEVSLGVIAGSSFAMNDLPEKVLYNICLTGDRIYADELYRYGAVTQVCPLGDLDRRVQQAAEKIRRQPPKAVKLFKECTRRCYDHRSEDLFRMETTYTDELLGTPEREECMRAFYEKREAVFED